MSLSSALLFVLPFNQSIRIKSASRNHTTSDAGAFLLRSVIDRTGILDFLTERLHDPRDPQRTQHPLSQLLLQWLLQLMQGWGSLWTDAVSKDAAFAASTSTRRGDGVVGSDRTLASQPTMSRLVRLLSIRENLSHLKAAVLKLAMEHLLVRNGGRRRDEVVIDVDAMPIDAHGNQLGSKYHGHYKRTIFLPLIASCGETGDVLGVQLRPGTQREVTDCEDFIVPIAHAVRQHVADQVIVRMDAGFNSGALCARLEAENIGYLMRLRKNKKLEQMAAKYVEDRPLEDTTCIELMYRAKSWECTRRVVLVIKSRPGELFDGTYFLVTNLDAKLYPGQKLVPMYSQRGKAEMHQGEMKIASSASLSSSPRPKSHYRQRPIERTYEVDPDAEVGAENDVRLQVFMLVYQLLHISRCNLHSPPPSSDETPGSEQTPPAPTQCAEGLPQTDSPPPAVEAVLDESTGGALETDAQDSPDLDREETHMHIRLFRLCVLKVGATMARHGRYVTFYIAQSAAQAWKRFLEHFQQLRWHTLPEY